MVNHKMYSLMLLTLIFYMPFYTFAQDECIGWAMVNGETSGGTGGTEVTVRDATDFMNHVKDGNNKIVKVKGRIYRNQLAFEIFGIRCYLCNLYGIITPVDVLPGTSPAFSAYASRSSPQAPAQT